MNEPYTIKDAIERLETIEGMLGVLVRQRMSNKQEKLVDEVMLKGRLDVKQVMNYLGISRPHSLTLMERVGKQFGFRFRKGDASSRTPSLVMYDKSLVIKDQHQRILRLLEEKGLVAFCDLMNEFGMDLAAVKSVAQDYVDTHKNCKIKDDNKLVRENGTVK